MKIVKKTQITKKITLDSLYEFLGLDKKLDYESCWLCTNENYSHQAIHLHPGGHVNDLELHITTIDSQESK